MAVEAIGAVVIQRVTDLLIQKSTFFDKFIDEVEDIRLDLRRMRGFLIDAERRLGEDDKAKKWAEKFLRTLFSLEDDTEKYVLGLARRRGSFVVFLERHSGFFFHDYLGSGRSLRLSLKSIRDGISELKRTKPDEVKDASLQGRSDGSSSDDDAKVTERGVAVQGRGEGEGEANEDDEGGSTSMYSVADSTTAGGVGDLRNKTSFDKDLGSPRSFSPGKTSRKISNGRKCRSFPEYRRGPGHTAATPQSPGRSVGSMIPSQSLRTFSNQKKDYDIVGFREDIDRLVDRLKRKADGVIPVVGPSGSGKTTLVRSVYKRLDIKAHFGDNHGDCRVWVHLPNEEYSSITGLWMKMVQEITKSRERSMSDPDQMRTRLINFLEEEEQKKRRYLIVLDSMSSLDVWKELSSGFPKLDQRETKVVLITLDNDLAKSISRSPQYVSGLKDQDSWKLFLEKLGSDAEEILKDHPNFRSKIMKECKHLPLYIVLLGGLLSTKVSGHDEWSWYLAQAKWHKMDILSLSYNDLPAHSKLCLLYMSLFPAEADISVRRLHRLWLAEGFVRRSPGMTEEESVEECFDDLVRRNLVKISKLKSDESFRNCRLPCAIREYLLPKARDISLFHIHRECAGGSLPLRDPDGLGLGESLPSHEANGLGVRRIVEYADIRTYDPRVPTSSDSSPFENLRSYLSFNFQTNDTPAKEVEKFISKNIGTKGFGLLRVLDLERVYKPTLPETLKQLFHLRYLGLRWTFTDHLPDCVGDLPYLETLDLKRTYINSLPSSIWKLKHLRYLNLPNICLEYKQKRRPSSFTELQTLLGMVVDETTPVKDDLDQLLKLRELGMTCQLNSFEDTLTPLPVLWSWIQKLKNLRSLWLRSKDEMGRPSKITLMPLQELNKLSHMSLMGTLEKLVAVDQFPPNLKVLSLSVSRLREDPMRILSRLPHLSVLRLLADSYLDERMFCPGNGFIKLLAMKIWMLKKLVNWEVEEGGMPCLKELNIRKCPGLQQIPPRLLSQGTLEEVTLTSMPKNFVEDVRCRVNNVGSKNGHHIMVNVNDYDFTKLPWESEADSSLWQVS